MGGEKLTPEELARILASEAPLIFAQSQWVEIDRAKLREALDKWRQAAAASMNGIPFHIRSASTVPGKLAARPVKRMNSTPRRVDRFAPAGNSMTSPRQIRDPARFLTEESSVPGLAVPCVPISARCKLDALLSGMVPAHVLADDMGLGKPFKSSRSCSSAARRAQSRAQSARGPRFIVRHCGGNWRLSRRI